MNHLGDLERIIRNASQPGCFRRDARGNEHAISGYIVRFSHEARVRGQEETVTTMETAVVVAPNAMTAKLVATRPYSGVNIFSVDEHHLNNPTILRVPSI